MQISKIGTTFSLMGLEDTQCLIASLDDAISATQVVKDILKDDFKLKETADDEKFYLWNVNNKYFTAQIKICCCNVDWFFNLTHKELNIPLEAVVFVFSWCQVNDVSKLTELTSILAHYNPEVCLLLNTDDKVISNNKLKEDFFAWSIENNFEYIESVLEDEDERDDEFVDKYGVDRVIEALNSHVWSGHVRKDNNPATKSNSLMAEQKVFEENESFEQMFSKFQMMKEKAQSLEGDARKEYAENVALSFMEALGIDDED